MLLKKAFFLTFILTLLLLSACSSGEDADNTTNAVAMPVILSIPATDGPMTTRAGDPGDYEHFKLPKYAYIYIICKDLEGNDFIVHAAFTLNDRAWSPLVIDNGDSVYRYTDSIKVYLPIQRQAEGKVYAALSSVALGGLPSRSSSANESEETVRNYKFRLTDNVKNELANIYSTPYNYRPDGATYYGTMHNLDTPTPSLSLMLYHAAAKLDLKWNVDPAIQDTFAISTMQMTLPSADSVYIFRPLETERTKLDHIDISINPGNQWYGRDVRYIAPVIDNYYNNYIIGLTVKSVQGTTRTSPQQSIPFDYTQPFTPWIRATINIK